MPHGPPRGRFSTRPPKLARDVATGRARLMGGRITEPKAAKPPSGVTRGFCELTLEARDPEVLACFYQEIFGWEELSRQEDRVWLGCGEQARLGLWSPGQKEFGDEGGRHVHFALSIRPGGLNELVEHLTLRGVKHRGPVEHEGGDRSVYLEDPEGNVVEAWDFFERGKGAREGVDALR